MAMPTMDGDANIGGMRQLMEMQISAGNAIVDGIIMWIMVVQIQSCRPMDWEMIWHEEVTGRTSWGFGGEYNFFADEVRVGGSGAAAPAYQLEVFGSIGVSGEINGVSDRRLKRNIEPIEDALSTVSKLNPVGYDFRTDEFPEWNCQPETRWVSSHRN